MFIAGRHVPFVSITNYTEGGKGEGESPLVYLAQRGDMFIAGRHVPFVSITNYTEEEREKGRVHWCI